MRIYSDSPFMSVNGKQIEGPRRRRGARVGEKDGMAMVSGKQDGAEARWRRPVSGRVDIHAWNYLGRDLFDRRFIDYRGIRERI